jgi:tRNA nucleotidyltransferase (CCA-adding enzyme)
MIPLPEGIGILSETFFKKGFKLYLVGGYVRNMSLSLSGGDFDVCSFALPEEAALFLYEAGFTIIEKAPELGTIEIHFKHGGRKLVFEHTTFRRDFYPEGGEHRPKSVEFTKNIDEDAARRDFTVNALYLDIKTGKITDPTKKGLSDLKERIIRAAASDPDITIRDDGLRIMRMARFAAELDFSISSDLLECASKRAYLLKDISAERKRDELKKTLMADTKYTQPGNKSAPEKGLMILKDTGALKFVLPLLCEGEGVLQSDVYHRYDVLEHGIKTCAAAPPVFELRLAALLHDIGKPEAFKKNGKMYEHELIGEELAKKELESLRFDNKTKNTVLLLIKNHMFDLQGNARANTIRIRAVRMGRSVFEMLIELRRADCIGSGNLEYKDKSADRWQRELERMTELNVPWSISELKIKGEDIMNILGIGSSPVVGKIINELFIDCVMDPKLNCYDRLKERAIRQGNKLLL